MERNFHGMLAKKWREVKFICVGLDTDYEKIPAYIKNDRIRQSLFLFNKAIIDATKDLVCAYKPNTAFYEKYGSEGIAALEDTIEYIRVDCSDYEVPVILDAKRADIGNTNDGYVAFAFDHLKADAITVHWSMGSEAMKPFLERKEKGIIVLCRTSNHGAEEFQDLPVVVGYNHSKKLFEIVAETVQDKWNYNNNCLLVVGATYPEELKLVREIVGDMPILVPGVGKQGGILSDVLSNGLTKNRRSLIVNSSRDVIYASSGEDFTRRAIEVVQRMNMDVYNHFDALKLG